MATKNTFVHDLGEVQRRLEALATPNESGRVVEWSMTSASWKILREIRAEGPIDTRESYKRWGFEKLRSADGQISFAIFNDAPALRGRLKGHAYAGWVYAKGGVPPSRGVPGAPLIARPIIKRAIMTTKKEITENFYSRLNKYLDRGSK